MLSRLWKELQLQLHRKKRKYVFGDIRKYIYVSPMKFYDPSGIITINNRNTKLISKES